jgi:uncharacterized protein
MNEFASTPHLTADYPAAHSMDTYWFAMDEAGEVAFLSSHETGPVPKTHVGEATIYDLIKHLDKDEYGIPVFPVSHELFPEGFSVEGLERFLLRLSAEERQSISRLAFELGLSDSEKEEIRKTLSGYRLNAIVMLADPIDPKGSVVSGIVRLDPAKAIYHITSNYPNGYSENLCLLLNSRLLAWRSIPLDSGIGEGLTSVYGIYRFEEDRHRPSYYLYCEKLDSSLFSPVIPDEYHRNAVPDHPRKGLPNSMVVSDGARTSGPLIHRLPGIRFAETEWIQVADLVPCFDWTYGDIDPDSGESIIRRSIAAIFSADSGERDSHLAKWREAAGQGDLVAHYALAYACEHADPPDFSGAHDWYARAAELALAAPFNATDIYENGSAAQCCLANMYEGGIGVAKNDAEAFRWYEAAAIHGNRQARRHLGEMYLEGRGVVADHRQARFWLLGADEWGTRLLDKVRDRDEAERGDPYAQYLEGYFERDEERANAWYWRSAEQGYTPAQIKLAWTYLKHGRDEKCLRLAQEWFAKVGDVLWSNRLAGALSGEIQAMFDLATWFDASHADSERLLNSIYWYRKVAECERVATEDEKAIIATAQFCLAKKYEQGRYDLPDLKNMAQALLWYQKSAANGLPEARQHLENEKNGSPYSRLLAGFNSLQAPAADRDWVKACDWLAMAEPNYSVEVREVFLDAAKRAHEAGEGLAEFECVAEGGNATAQFHFAHVLESGAIGPKKPEEAALWYRQAAEQGHAGAQFRLGEMYWSGLGVAFGMKEARTWFSKAAAQGHDKARANLSIWDRAEKGEILCLYSLAYKYQDAGRYAEAVDLYRKAADLAETKPVESSDMFQNGSAAQCNLADKYEHGQGIPQDYAQALYWYRKSAAKNNHVAQYSLGMMYLEGRGVSMDLAEARRWLTLSKNQGYADAGLALNKVAAG